MNMFNQEQIEADVLERLKDFRKALDMAINAVEKGQVFELTEEERKKYAGPPGSILIGDWMITKRP